MTEDYRAVESPIIFAEALAHPCMDGAELVAGRAGLHRAVHGVSVLDLSDLDSIQNGQFVISSAYPLVDVDLPELIEVLFSLGACAFGVKLSNFWPDLPKQSKASADTLELPLLILPEGPFDDIVNPLMMEIADRQTITLHKLSDLHNALTNSALNNEGDPRVVIEILQQALARHVAIVEYESEVVIESGGEKIWDTDQMLEVAAAARGEREPIDSPTDFPWVVVPIPGPDSSVGALLIEGEISANPFAVGAGAQAAAVLGILLAGRKLVDGIYRDFRRDLLEDVACERVSPSESRERAKLLGWSPDEGYVVFVVDLNASPAGMYDRKVEGTSPGQLIQAIEEDLAKHIQEVNPFLKHPGVGLIVRIQDPENQEVIVRKVITKLIELLDRTMPEWHAPVGVSDYSKDLAELPDEFTKAALALRLGARDDSGQSRVLRFSDLGFLRLFREVRDRERLLENARLILQPLSDGATGMEAELLDTLAILLTHNMNLRATASKRYVHYNTIRHRLSRLRELFGDRLSRPTDRLAMSLAISALRFARAEEELTSFSR